MTSLIPTSLILPSDRLSTSFQLVRQEPGVPAGAPTVFQQTTVLASTRLVNITNDLLDKGIVFTDARLTLEPIDNGVRITVVALINGVETASTAELIGTDRQARLVLPHRVISPATSQAIGTLGTITVARVFGFTDTTGRQLTGAEVGAEVEAGSIVNTTIRAINVIAKTSSSPFMVRLPQLDFLFRPYDIESALIYLQASTDN